jgi:hypothetical protein|nr:MAG: hypothetical protein TU35_02975 [Thermoproteus sp. AZ2]
MNRITWAFKKFEAYVMLFILGILYLYFKSKIGIDFVNSMRAFLIWSIIFPLLFYIAIGEGLHRKTDKFSA